MCSNSFNEQPGSIVLKTNDLDDLLSNVADEIDDEYKNDDLLSSVQSVDDIHSIYSFGTHHMFSAFLFGIRAR